MEEKSVDEEEPSVEPSEKEEEENERGSSTFYFMHTDLLANNIIHSQGQGTSN